MTPLILSLKPQYADLLFAGRKTIELRRQIALGIQGREVYVYVSSPVKEIWGHFRVEKVFCEAPNDLWNRLGTKVGIARSEYDTYYQDCRQAYALQVADVRLYGTPISLETLRDKWLDFRPPQSWRYAKEREVDWLARHG